MCVRTKTSYGCGHSYKTTDDCFSSRCAGLERYHYMKAGDCRSCKTGGEMVTRGREGKGRYAQQMSRRSSDTPLALDVTEVPDPWAHLPAKEKDWESPTRRQADEAWQKEHDKRMEDLQARTSKLGAGSPTSASPRPIRYAPPESDEHYYSQDSDSSQRRRDTTAKTLHHEIRAINQPPRSRHANDSYESFESEPLPPRSARAAPRPHARSYDYYDQVDSGYGSYTSHKSLVPRREPFYSQPPQSRVYEVPVSPMAYPPSYSNGGYGVEIFPRSVVEPRMMSRRRW